MAEDYSGPTNFKRRCEELERDLRVCQAQLVAQEAGIAELQRDIEGLWAAYKKLLPKNKPELGFTLVAALPFPASNFLLEVMTRAAPDAGQD